MSQDTGATRLVSTPADTDTLRVVHRTIAGVRDDLDNLRFNTAIAKLIECNNHLTKLGGCPADVADTLVLMLAPLAPHTTCPTDRAGALPGGRA